MFGEIGKYGNKTALIEDNGQKMTYSELVEEGNRIFGNRKERNLIFILCTNSIGSVCGYIGSIRNRQVPLLLSAALDAQLLDYLLKLYEPSYLWVPGQAVSAFPYGKIIYESYGYTLIDTGNGPCEMNEELSLLLTTSGSTGSPKLVRQSYENLDSNTKSIIQYLQLDDTERAITTLPMNYTYGLSIINTHIAAGAAVLLTDQTLIQKKFWEFFNQYEATSFGGVPYTYEILNKLKFFQMDLGHLRYMTQAGGKLSEELHKKFAEYARDNGKKFVVMYGQTEATARMAYLPSDRSLEKYGSMGIAIPDGRFELWDINRNIITEPNITGELVYYGKNVTLGYAECREDLKKGDERHGRLETGDMAKRDADGFFYIVGRKKRFLKVYGNRVNLDETERMIKGHFEDLSCACSGMDDCVYIFIETQGGCAVSSEEIKEYISKKTGLNKNALHVKNVEQIPKNDAGKTLYTELHKYMDIGD